MSEGTAMWPRTADYGSLACGVGGVVVLYLALCILNPYPIADEQHHHLPAIRHFYEGQWFWPEDLPMIPTYHVVAAGVAKIFGDKLYVLRGFSAALAIAAVLAFRGITKHRALVQADDSLLHFAWQPILFPFLALVYTEAAAVLCLVGAVYFHVRRQWLLSALVLLLACLVRQSNVVWVALMATWAVVEQTEGKRPTIMSALRSIWPHVLIVLIAAMGLLVKNSPMLRGVEANRPRFNVAQLYSFALFVIVLWLPIWAGRLHQDWRSLWHWATARSVRGLPAAILTALVIAILILCFRNPHPWNHIDRFIRNWPLILMSESLVARVVGACVITAVGLSIVRFTLEQPSRRTLALVWLFSLVFLVAHSLAEPRYYIVPMILINLLTQYTASQARHITLWYLAVSAAVGVTVCVGGGPDGGIW
ncbi:MAG: Dol-P-Glc:Glc(2)Man(9)GlcNAc(2)-PP-Dol alpha-1,2-glucosyltransferase [Planctomycetes bacterium]|nr:Dol-P-Glc:Glc(2)Man(9)GlcNAc(2)-PP-Dol alpha-1,2-glucosyltransferase [Planctomycetota bacterium]